MGTLNDNVQTRFLEAIKKSDAKGAICTLHSTPWRFTTDGAETLYEYDLFASFDSEDKIFEALTRLREEAGRVSRKATTGIVQKEKADETSFNACFYVSFQRA